MKSAGTITKTYNHLEAGHPLNPRPFAVCGAKSRTKEDGVCLNVAGAGTKHKGMGRCRFHGGNTPTGTANPMYRHGRYIEGALTGRLAEIYSGVSETRKTNPLELWEELNVQRTLLVYKLEQLENGIDKSNYRNHKPGKGKGSSTTTDEDHVTSEKVGGGGVVVVDGGKVSSSLAVSGSAKSLGGGMVAMSEDDIGIVRDLVNDIVGTAQKITGMINQDRLTSAEILFTLGVLREVINEFIPDADKQRAFVNRIRERIPAMTGQMGIAEDGEK